MTGSATPPFLSTAIVGVEPHPSGLVVVGFNWTAVEGPRAIGLAATPSRADGARTTPETGSYGGRTLDAVSQLALSENPYERAIGLAACNAHWNADRPDLMNGDGLEIDPSLSTVVVGRFPGLETKCPNAIVLERNPGLNDLPADRAPDVIPSCEQLVITATTLVNGTIDALISLAPEGCHITLVGPGTPLCPALFSRNIPRLAGFVATDREACLKAVMEGAGARAFKRFGRPVILQKD